jgi:hypothetical protein
LTIVTSREIQVNADLACSSFQINNPSMSSPVRLDLSTDPDPRILHTGDPFEDRATGKSSQLRDEGDEGGNCGDRNLGSLYS